jgi:hypothetical protein
MRPILFDEASADLFAGVKSLPLFKFNQRANRKIQLLRKQR